jgi:hypothetical protein
LRARLVVQVVDGESLEDAQDALAALGVRTELNYERTMVRSSSANSSSQCRSAAASSCAGVSAIV